MNIFSFLFFFPSHTRNVIQTKLHYYNLDKLLNGTMYDSVLEFNKIDNETLSDEQIIFDELNSFNYTRYAMKYGAYTRHLPPDDSKEYKKPTKNKKPNKRKYVNKFIHDSKKNNKIKKDDKPIVFLVSPEQLNHYKVYNKIMNKNKTDESANFTSNSTLPNGWNDDDYYLWF